MQRWTDSGHNGCHIGYIYIKATVSMALGTSTKRDYKDCKGQNTRKSTVKWLSNEDWNNVSISSHGSMKRGYFSGDPLLNMEIQPTNGFWQKEK
jgi:hypothetical protein